QLAGQFGIDHLHVMDGKGGGSFAELADRQQDSFSTVARDDDDLASLLYSSGTTGLPKGIMLTHRNLQSNAEMLVDFWGFTDADVLFHCLPIFHVHGLFVALGCVLLSGAKMRWSPSFSPALARAHLPQCTVMMGVPTYYTRLLDDPAFTQEHCPNMRLFISGSAPLLVETFEGFEDRTGHRILERYGMTETGMNTSNPLDGDRRPGTVGPALPGVEVRILDDDGASTPLGEVGNLQVRGDNVFKAYWRMPEKTAEDFREGRWFNTGDQATLDADGYVSIVGRSKDMVISGGLNVYPKEV
ncbi:MAG: AMP-binding protein, partial [Desulfuromonadales bacterium]|nr:AMP-binding protein [Desulfuromonadales bacterium]